MLQLTRPLVFFDIESTGLDRENDRIIQLAVHTMLPGFTPGLARTYLVNPDRPIPPESTAIHGITDAMVAERPRFVDIAGVVYQHFVGCDVAGYNSNNFDVPMLFHEFSRAGFVWKPGHLVDVGNLFKIRETRTLEAAVKFYCGRQMENSHDAGADAMETVKVFMAQLQRYEDLPTSVEELALYTNYGMKVADLSGKFVYDTTGDLRYNFGKYRGERVSDHLDFAHWMYYKADFPADTNEILAEVLDVYGKRL